MKALVALGLVMLIVSGLLAAAIVSLRPVAEALAICGLALVVFALLFGGRIRARRRRGPYSWEEDADPEPQEVYRANPGPVELRARPGGTPVEFTDARPGPIPVPREDLPASSRPDYSPGASEIPTAAPKRRARPDYQGPPSDPLATPAVAPLTATGITHDLLDDADPHMPPMAPPPPR